MSDDKHQDRLEDFFRKSIETYEEAPGDHIWQRLHANIPGKPIPKIGVISIVIGAACIGIAGFLVAWFLQSDRISGLEDRIASLEQQEDLTAVITSTEMVHVPDPETLTPLSPFENTPERKKSISGKAPINPVKEKKDRQLPIESSITPGIFDKNEEPVEFSDAVFQDAGVLTERVNPVNDMLPIGFIDTIQPMLDENNSPILPDLPVIPHYHKMVYNHEIAVAFKTFLPSFLDKGGPYRQKSSAYSWETTVMTDLKFHPSFAVQLGVGYRWVTFDGLQRLEDIRYDEQGAWGNAEIAQTNRYSILFPNHYTDYRIETEITQQLAPNETFDPLLKSGDPFGVTARLRHGGQHFIFPVLLKADFGQNRLQWLARAGFVSTIQLKSTTLADLTAYGNNRLSSSRHEVTDVYSFNGPKVEVFLSGGVQYGLTRKWQIFAEPVANLSIIGKYPGVKPTQIGLQIGIRKD